MEDKKVILSESGVGRLMIEFNKIELEKKCLPTVYLKIDPRPGYYSYFADENGNQWKFVFMDGDIWTE